METPDNQSARLGREDSARLSRRLWLIWLGALFVMFFAMLLPRHRPAPANPPGSGNASDRSALREAPSKDSGRRAHGSALPAGGPAAEEIVAGKVTQFAHNRLEVTRAMAERFKVSVPREVELFFEAVAAGRWEELNARFNTLRQLREGSGEQAEAVQKLWGPILETLLIAENAHDWPAQRLLDYGNSILGSLRPGMIYVGGTDPGRGIPTLLNETSEGEHHIVITQNALADSTYQQYVNFLYEDQMAVLTPEESQRAFQEYLADAQKRLAHDLQFPDEPKQIRPGEDVRLKDSANAGSPSGPGIWTLSTSGVQVSGQVAVMAINEKLLQAIMDKNPDRAFAIEESFPLKSTYPDASLIGPLMELRAGGQNPLTPEMAAQALDYWRQAAKDLSMDTATGTEFAPQKTYSKMVVAQAGLLADHNFSPEAEQAYRIAIEICPYNPEAVFRFVSLLTGQQRWQDALSVAQLAISADPKNAQFQTLVTQLRQTAQKANR